MNAHLHDEAAPAHVARAAGHRRDGPSPGTAMAIHLQRAAGNAAVSGLLTAPRPAQRLMAIQRCGPTPCDCPPEERAQAAGGAAPAEHAAEEASAAVG